MHTSSVCIAELWLFEASLCENCGFHSCNRNFHGISGLAKCNVMTKIKKMYKISEWMLQHYFPV